MSEISFIIGIFVGIFLASTHKQAVQSFRAWLYEDDEPKKEELCKNRKIGFKLD